MILKNLFIFFILLQFVVVGCGESPGTGSTITNPPPVQGTRVLGLDVKSVPSVTYAMAYDQAMQLGAREVSVSLDWPALEPTVGTYDDTLPAIIEAFYPLQTGDITLVLRPLDTPGPRLPADIAGLAFDDLAVITAFENFLTHLHSQLNTLNASGKLKWIHVGNEIDATLGSDATKWAQWQTFFNAARIRIKSLWGTSVVVSSIVQFSALNNINTRNQYLNFLPKLDSAVLTYYPLYTDFTMRPPSTVASDFNFIVNTIPGKSILIQECGYPSSTINNSSETLQADFVSAVFEAWDTHRDRISLIDFTWQYDVSEATVDQWVIDFGMTGQPNENNFKQYLWTLGLSNYDSTEKPGLQRMRDELLTRKWLL
ncbi:MAG: glycosyl hydrolase 53 family protein [Thiohalomonadales bacterium]